MMLDWNDCHRQILATLAEVGRLSPDTLRGYRSMPALIYSTRVLDAGASVGDAAATQP